MPYNEIDEIRIKINGTNDSALNAIGAVADRLTSLRTAITAVNNVDTSNFAKKVDAIGKAFGEMTKKSMTGLTSFANAMNKLQEIDVPGIQGKITPLSKAISDLSSAVSGTGFTKSLTSGLSAISRFGKTLNTFDNSKTSTLAESINQISEALKGTTFDKGLVSGLNAIKGFVNSMSKASIQGALMVATMIRDIATRSAGLSFNKGMIDGLNAISRFVRTVQNVSKDAFVQFAAGIRVVAREASALKDIDVKKLEALATAMKYASRSRSGKEKIDKAAQELGTKEYGDTNTSGAGDQEQGPVYESTNDRLARFNARIKTAIKHMLSFKSASRSAGHATSGLAGRLRGLISDFARILKYRMLRSFIRMITQSFTTGIKNAYQYAVATGNQFQATMDRMATTALYVKNSLGAMAMPLLNTLAPAIDYVADKFVALLNTINQFIASITGQATWTKALRYTKSFGDGTANAANGAKKAADDLKATILGIDEINLLNDNNERAGSGGSGGAAADDYSAMFETVETKASKFSQTLKDLFQPFKDAWDNVGAGVMDQWEYATSSINDLLSDVGTTFKNVWTGGTGQKIIENILTAWQGIETAVGNVATGIKEAWDNNGNGQRIAENLFGIFEDISGVASDIADDIANWASDIDFNPLIEAFADFTDGLKSFVDAVLPLIRKLIDALEPFVEWVLEKGLPGVVKGGGAVLEAGGKILQGDFGGANDAMTDYFDYLNGTGRYSNSKSGANTMKNPNYQPRSDNRNFLERLFDEVGQVFELDWSNIKKGLTSGAVRDVFKNAKSTLTIDMIKGKVDDVIDIIAKAGGVAGGNSVGSGGKKLRVKADVKTTADSVTETLLDMFGGGDTITKDLSVKTDSTNNQQGVKQWINLKDTSVVKTLKSKLDNLFTSNKTAYDTTYQNGNVFKNLKSKLIDFFKPQSTWTDTYKDEDATKNLKSKLDALFRNNVAPWSNTYQPGTVTKTLTSALTSQFTTNKNTYNGLQSKTVTGTLDAEKTANFTQLTKEYVDLKSGTKKLTFDTEFKVKLKLDSGSDKTTITENVLNGRISYASGGFPASGQIFFANEDGSSEYIGKFGNQTAVANNDQIVQGIAQGVSSAQAEQNRLLREQNELLRAIYNKEGRNNGTTSSDVLRALNQTSRRTGHPVVSMG